MSFPSYSNRTEVYGAIGEEFDSLYAELEAWGSVQHKTDGSHGAITADSLIVSGTVSIAGAMTLGSALVLTNGLTTTGLVVKDLMTGSVMFSVVGQDLVFTASGGNHNIVLGIGGNLVGTDGSSAIHSMIKIGSGIEIDADAIGVKMDGALSVVGNLSVNTNKFTVDGATGNTLVAGTLGVTGAVTGASYNTALTVTGATGTMALTAPASQNSTLKLSSPSTFASSVRFDEASTNIWQVGYNITGTTKNFELFNTANGASLLTLTANALATLKAPASQNAQFKADCTGANGFGSQFVATSKTTGGATNTWNVGTGVTGGTNAFEFFNDSIGANVLKLYLNGTIALPNLPTSAAGLVSGDIWCDTGAANVLKRV